jgi:hypothetical protein
MTATGEWSKESYERSITFLPPCGHYRFPVAYRQTVEAIDSQSPPEFVCGCFTVDRERKRQMQDYVLALDAWLAGARPAAVAGELACRAVVPRGPLREA